MKSAILQDNLKIETAKEEEWEPILKLLQEAGLVFWLTGNENHNGFYVVKDIVSKNIICCFAIECQKDVGILKSFAIKNNFQGKGVGKSIVDNKIGKIAKELGISKLYAASQEAPGFWRKTIFNEIQFSAINDPFFLAYINKFKDKIKNYFENTWFFIYNI